jgi:triphosphoribosyl-dephospho-CoA synthase
VQIACALEVSADKPGNVTRRLDFGDTCLVDFVTSALAIGPAFQAITHACVGETILQAVQDTRRLVHTNTNLGMVLLMAPLAKGAATGHPGGLRAAVSQVLEKLAVDDAKKAYEAIRIASPAGLGAPSSYDVRHTEVDISLREAMRLAQHRDTVAREYVTDFEVTFELGYTTLSQVAAKGHRFSDAIVQTGLTILAQIPDTLIARKEGLKVSQDVSRRADQVLQAGGALSERGREALHRFDVSIRDEKHRLNPGTTADLVAAALFVFLVEGGGLQNFPELLSRW